MKETFASSNRSSTQMIDINGFRRALEFYHERAGAVLVHLLLSVFSFCAGELWIVQLANRMSGCGNFEVKHDYTNCHMHLTTVHLTSLPIIFTHYNIFVQVNQKPNFPILSVIFHFHKKVSSGILTNLL